MTEKEGGEEATPDGGPTNSAAAAAAPGEARQGYQIVVLSSVADSILKTLSG